MLAVVKQILRDARHYTPGTVRLLVFIFFTLLLLIAEIRNRIADKSNAKIWTANARTRLSVKPTTKKPNAAIPPEKIAYGICETT